MNNPKVTVLMPVYNVGIHLHAAAKSILTQTFTDFEFIVVDDGSEDGSPELIERMADPRIHLIRAPHGGLVAALNLGMSHAKGEYLARMDADDIAHPERLALQVTHLDERPDIGLVCSNVTIIDGEGNVTGKQVEPNCTAEALVEGLLYQRRMKPIIHPSVMMRREVFETLGGYRDFKSAEDRDFWLRASDSYRFSRLNQALLSYRIHATGISREKGAEQAVSSAMAALNYLVYRGSKVDLFQDQPETFQATAKTVRTRMETEVLDAAVAFRAARDEFRNGSRIKGCIAGIAALLRHGRRALPNGSVMGTRTIINELSADLIGKLLGAQGLQQPRSQKVS
ncbi:glycosyltransferase [Phaeobacter sp. B1627]|uniref:glycosyltransferase n=1 Tax=Phaeobacter sp. B1627 TaxID=2583809 RepID=UPI00111A6CF6|nr:glycosyltransferase [Phaeobacter sp. B1627]TNJ40966.1 glycosyltransferase [Phaeobacter sp. B1627]